MGLTLCSLHHCSLHLLTATHAYLLLRNPHHSCAYTQIDDSLFHVFCYAANCSFRPRTDTPIGSWIHVSERLVLDYYHSRSIHSSAYCDTCRQNPTNGFSLPNPIAVHINLNTLNISPPSSVPIFYSLYPDIAFPRTMRRT